MGRKLILPILFIFFSLEIIAQGKVKKDFKYPIAKISTIENTYYIGITSKITSQFIEIMNYDSLGKPNFQTFKAHEIRSIHYSRDGDFFNTGVITGTLFTAPFVIGSLASARDPFLAVILPFIGAYVAFYPSLIISGIHVSNKLNRHFETQGDVGKFQEQVSKMRRFVADSTFEIKNTIRGGNFYKAKTGFTGIYPIKTRSNRWHVGFYSLRTLSNINNRFRSNFLNGEILRNWNQEKIAFSYAVEITYNPSSTWEFGVRSGSTQEVFFESSTKDEDEESLYYLNTTLTTTSVLADRIWRLYTFGKNHLSVYTGIALHFPLQEYLESYSTTNVLNNTNRYIYRDQSAKWQNPSISLTGKLEYFIADYFSFAFYADVAPINSYRYEKWEELQNIDTNRPSLNFFYQNFTVGSGIRYHY